MDPRGSAEEIDKVFLKTCLELPSIGSASWCKAGTDAPSFGEFSTLPEGASVHLDRGYDSKLTREHLEELGLGWEISGKGKPAPYWATYRWVVERTSAWQAKLAHNKLVWCTERVGRVIDFWMAFSDVVIIVRRLIREGWVRYRWEGRPSRRP